MGTGGSRYGAGRPAYRPTAESYRRLDIRKMLKAGCIKSNNRFGWQWSDDAGKQVASVMCRVDDEAHVLTVTYSWKNLRDTKWQPVDKQICLTSTLCNYGGKRWWFKCPCCPRRAAVLYIMGGWLRCAKCGRLSYASQRGNVTDRAWIRQRKLESKLRDYGQKPKRMRWGTFTCLREKISECERLKNNAFIMAMIRLRYSI